MVTNPPAMKEIWVQFLDWEDPPGEGNSYPLQYSGLENSMDRGAWQATVHRVTKSWTGLSDFHTYIRGTYIYRTFVTREKVFITGDTNYYRKSVCSVTQLCLTLSTRGLDFSRQKSLSMELFRREHWDRLPFPSPDLEK